MRAGADPHHSAEHHAGELRGQVASRTRRSKALTVAGVILGAGGMALLWSLDAEAQRSVIVAALVALGAGIVGMQDSPQRHRPESLPAGAPRLG